MSLLRVLLLLLAPSNTFAEAPRVIFAQVGNSVTLPRKLWGEKEKIHVNWFFNDEQLINRNPTGSSQKQVPQNWQGRLSFSSDFSLIISPVNESDFGIFKCEQYELVNKITNTYKLYHVTMSTPSPLLVDTSLLLSCEIEQEGFNLVGFGPWSVTWTGPDGKFYSGKSERNRHTLRVNKVSRSHSGNWICEIKYEAQGRTQAMRNVLVIDLAQSSPEPIYVANATSNFALPCSLSSNLPWSTVHAAGLTGGSWSFVPIDGSESFPSLLKLHPSLPPAWKSPNGSNSWLMESEVKTHELGVKIFKVSIKHRGNFTCSLDFGSKTLSSTVQLEVLQVISSAGEGIHEGNALNLTCTLGHPMPFDLEVKWKSPNNSPWPGHNLPHRTNLSIPEVSMKHSGKWTCELKRNGTVLTTVTIRVKIEKAPVNIWLLVAISGGVLVIILLSVIAVIVIRRHRKVMKYTRRRRRFCCCKNTQPKGFYKT